eukprot:m.126094 g.126094  ORF g.126094 m.126094 type:complete len:213 (-) comp16330_c0_seq2:130-768(-)
MSGVKADLTDWVSQDYEAVVTRAASEGKPLFIVGHSLGGQVVPLLPSKDLIKGLVNVGVGSGSVRHNVPLIRAASPILWHVLIPVLTPIFGYFPGSRFGVVGDMPTGAIKQWRKWCLTPEYLLTGEPRARAAYASARYPVMSLFFTDDELLTEEGSRVIHSAYTGTTVDFRAIRAKDLGQRRIGHFGFFRKSGHKLWPAVADWLDARVQQKD